MSDKNTTFVSEETLIRIIEANIDNPCLSDTDFREFIRNSLPIVAGTEHHTVAKLAGTANERLL